MDNELILQKIEELCAQKNWSKYMLAKQSGIKQSTLTSIFTKRSIVSWPNLLKISRAFGLTLSGFFALIEKEAQTIPESDLPVRLWNRLTDNDRRMVTTLMTYLTEKNQK
ncbi:MAG: helix-turn-helix transcriptional regulator [Hungatella sp.]